MSFPTINQKAGVFEIEGQPDLTIPYTKKVPTILVPAGIYNWIQRHLPVIAPALLLGGGGGAWYMSPSTAQPPAIHDSASRVMPDRTATAPNQGGVSTQAQQQMAEDLQKLQAIVEELAKQKEVTAPTQPVPPIRVQLEIPKHMMIGVEGPKVPEPQDVRPDPPTKPKTDMTPAQRRQYEIWVERR